MFNVIPEAVIKPIDESQELWSISYEKLTPVLIKSIQEQQQQIQIQKQQSEIETLKNELEIIKQILKTSSVK